MSAVLVKAFFTAVDVLELDVSDVATLLATSAKSVRRYRADVATARLHRDQVERMTLVIGIYESLRDIFGGSQIAIEWLRRPNRIFGDRAPLDRLRDGSIRDLIDVQHYLAANDGGVW
jgi:putative toxin-antitoxin system antitoxin component (TIGR02293 family)